MVPGPIDTRLNFSEDAGGRDPDRYSATLQRHHQLLWSKALPGGKEFTLSPVLQGSARLLRHESDLGTFTVSSDTLANSNRKKLRPWYDAMGAQSNESWYQEGGSIGGRLIFPSIRIADKQTLNQRRGTHPRIRDRFDLTLESIRRHYSRESSPLSDVLERYAAFFELFGTFDGYVGFFLLDDLVDSSAVRFYLPFEGFDAPPLPKSFEEYKLFRSAQLEFVTARNTRILRYAARIHAGTSPEGKVGQSEAGSGDRA